MRPSYRGKRATDQGLRLYWNFSSSVGRFLLDIRLRLGIADLDGLPNGAQYLSIFGAWLAPRGVKRVVVLIRGVRVNCFMTGRTEAILPTMPAPELLITAETGGESRMQVTCRRSTVGALARALATHMTLLRGERVSGRAQVRP
jgi:hypothetical protein